MRHVRKTANGSTRRRRVPGTIPAPIPTMRLCRTYLPGLKKLAKLMMTRRNWKLSRNANGSASESPRRRLKNRHHRRWLSRLTARPRRRRSWWRTGTRVGTSALKSPTRTRTKLLR
uniref:(northern house mosquito) hypothetical protein n=1 Tax=Culex pipiens TaxID=7175 RepID=A0A8D8NFF8_CULPI